MTFKKCCYLCFKDRIIRDEFEALTGYRLLSRRNRKTGKRFYFFAKGDVAWRDFIAFIYEVVWIKGRHRERLTMKLEHERKRYRRKHDEVPQRSRKGVVDGDTRVLLHKT